MGKLKPQTTVEPNHTPTADESLQLAMDNSGRAHRHHSAERGGLGAHNNQTRDIKADRVAERHDHLATRERQGRSRSTSSSAASRPLSPPATPRPPATPNRSSSPPRPTSPALYRQARFRTRCIQDGYPSILELLNNPKGGAQASPPYERNTTDDSPIDTVVRQIQETGRSARAKALQTAGALLSRIHQGKIEREAVRDIVFMTCVDMFERDQLDNLDEITLTFQLLVVLIQEGVMESLNFVRIALLLCDEGYYDGCKLLLCLIFSDGRVKLPEEDLEVLSDIASHAKLGKGADKSL